MTLDDFTWKTEKREQPLSFAEAMDKMQNPELFPDYDASVGCITLDGGWEIEIEKTEKGYSYDVKPVDKERNYDRSRDNINLNDFPKENIPDPFNKSYSKIEPNYYSEEEMNKILSLIQEEVNKREAEKEQTNEGNEAEKEPELPVVEEEKIFTAEDLQFSPALSREYDPQTGEPIDVVREQAVMQFDNGYGISVCKKENGDYFTMILDANGKRTPATELSSSGMISLDNIEKLNELMKDVQKLDQDGCVEGKEPTERGKELRLIGACERGDADTVRNLINGGVNVNINVVNVQMGDIYLQDSLLDRAKGNREILELLANGGLDMNRLEQRAENRVEENQGTSCEEGSKNRLQYLKKMRKLISNMVKITKNVVKKVAKTAIDIAVEVTGEIAQASEPENTNTSGTMSKLKDLRDKLKNKHNNNGINIVEDVEYEDLTDHQQRPDAIEQQALLPNKPSLRLPEYVAMKNGIEK